MSRFKRAILESSDPRDNIKSTRGENSHPCLTSDGLGDPLVALFDKLFQNIDEEYETKFQKSTNSKYYDLIETKKSHGKKVKTTSLKFNENSMKYE